MALTPLDELRQLIGEPIPEGGSDIDTIVTDDYLSQILEESGGSLNRAAAKGWQIKAAHYANLVNVTDGNAAREMGQLLQNAERMVRMYQKSSGSYLTDGRTRVGRIVRRT